jgi:hypothetical protein
LNARYLSYQDIAEAIVHDFVHALLSQKGGVGSAGAVGEALAIKVALEFRIALVNTEQRVMEQWAKTESEVAELRAHYEKERCDLRNAIEQDAGNRDHWGGCQDALVAGIGAAIEGEVLTHDIGEGLSLIKPPLFLEAEDRNYWERSQRTPSVSVAPNTAGLPADAGGINFTALPIVTQPAPSLGTVLSAQQNYPAGNRPYLDKEWQQIQRMLSGGIIPSNQRIKEYLMGVCNQQDCQQELDKVLSCFADIFRLEEERCCGTEAALKEMLVLLESDKSAQELQLALAQVRVEEKEPAVIEE